MHNAPRGPNKGDKTNKEHMWEEEGEGGWEEGGADADAEEEVVYAKPTFGEFREHLRKSRALDNSLDLDECAAKAHPASESAQRTEAYEASHERSSRFEDQSSSFEDQSSVWATVAHAVENGDLFGVNELLATEEGRNEVRHSATEDMSALAWAASLGHCQIVRQLLAVSGVAVDVLDANGWTPLIWAAKDNLHSVVRLLIDAGADVQRGSQDEGTTALMWAAQRGGMRSVRDLVEKGGADVQQASTDGSTALLWAARAGQTSVVEFLLDKGADVNGADKHKQTALTFACHSGYVDLVHALLRKEGCDISLRTSFEQTAAEIAGSWCTPQHAEIAIELKQRQDVLDEEERRRLLEHRKKRRS